MDLIYLAHPVRPLPGSTETVDSNLDDAEWWLVQLQRANPGAAIVAPWITCLRLGVDDDSDPALRAQGLARAQAAAARCTGIAICGPRIGSGSLAETRALGEGARWVVPQIHRFMRRDQDLEIAPRHRLQWCDFSRSAPGWLSRFLFGAAPHSIEIVGAEILAAIEREAVAA